MRKKSTRKEVWRISCVLLFVLVFGALHKTKCEGVLGTKKLMLQTSLVIVLFYDSCPLLLEGKIPKKKLYTRVPTVILSVFT